MRLRILALAAVAAAATPLIAQQASQIPGAPDPARITGGTYQTDPGHSLVGWQLNHLGINDYFGLFGDVKGTLTLDKANPGASVVDVTIPVSKVVTASTGLTAHLLKAAPAGGKADFFGANPADAHFISTNVAVTGTTAKITGNLTLNGVTKPVVLDAKFTGAGANPYSKVETVGFEALAQIKRSDFGIGYGVPAVSDDVKLNITVAFEKK